MRRNWRDAWIFLTLGLAVPLPCEASPPAEAPRIINPPGSARLREHVMTLASPGFEGRTGAGAAKARSYLIDEFRRLGLEPGFGDSFHQTILTDDAERRPIGANVAALLRGSDPALSEEFVILSAHFDHLGIHEGRLFPGADDNASGVAAMLETARCLAERPSAPKRSVLFVGFDLEEPGLIGSRYFVRNPPWTLDRLKLFITSDMIGRSLGGVETRDVFVLGSEFAPGLRSLVKTAAEGDDIRVNLLGSDVLVIDRSDYGPFRGQEVPHLFFSTGENPAYHTPDDLPETLDYGKLEAIARVLRDLTEAAALADELPPWAPTSEPSLDEAAAMLHIFQEILAHREQLRIPAYQAALLANAERNLEAIVAEGKYSATQRQTVLRLGQLVLFTLP